jgi:DNA-binding MarR family transcriptional regulator
MATRVVTRHYDRALAPIGLTASSYAILARTDREGPLAVGELAARLALDRTTLSRELAPLLDDGFACVSSDPRDRRRRVVALTPKGRRAVAAARPLWAKAQEELVADFGEQRTDALMGELHTLIGAA